MNLSKRRVRKADRPSPCYTIALLVIHRYSEKLGKQSLIACYESTQRSGGPLCMPEQITAGLSANMMSETMPRH